MGDFDPIFVQTLARQSWSFYGVGMFLILLRMYAGPSLKALSRLQFLTRVAGMPGYTSWVSKVYSLMTI
jgi:hypothetical protein